MGKKILIVDDEADIIMLVKVRLESQGYEVVTAGNGKEGLEAVKDAKFDLIISDVLMPEMDGFEFCKALKADPGTAKTPIIVLTARGKMEDTFVSMGVTDFVAKPFVPQEFIAKVKEAIEKGEVIAKEEEVKEEPAKEEPAKEEPAAPPTPKAPEGPQKRILVGCKVDHVIKSLQKWAKVKKWHVEILSSGAEIVNMAPAYSPDVIVLDVFLDNKSSKDTMNKIRKIRNLKEVPIVLYSFLDKDNLGGVSLPKRQMEIETSKNVCMQAGAKEFISDVEDPSFTAVIEKYIG